MTIAKDRRNFYILTESEKGFPCEDCGKRERAYGWDYTTFHMPNHVACMWLCKKCVKKRFKKAIKEGKV